MGTPFISFIGPSRLEGYRPGAPPESQPATLPNTFLDAMEVRGAVFVEEQGVPSENEFDPDDPRSCHWVAYASVNTLEEQEIRNVEGNIIQPRRSVTRTTPIGTIRVVPFPHEPHPELGGEYWNGELMNPSHTDKITESTERRLSMQMPFGTDRKTTLHDGKEPYVKIGRLAVLKGYRSHGIAKLLVSTVLNWLRQNQSYFDPSVKEMGLEQLGAESTVEIPKWTGLVCVHAQEQVAPFWAKWGFQLDEGMGKWMEEGLPHVGMFQRLQTEPKRINI
jgi:predicted GNAT family N-acyltransferase